LTEEARLKKGLERERWYEREGEIERGKLYLRFVADELRC
jgi:hypothetical protein